MSIYHDLKGMKDLALVDALQFGSNVNVIISNPDASGEFSLANGSTYEKVADSYFNKPRTAVIVYKTDDEPNIEFARALVKKDGEQYLSGSNVNYCVTLVAKGLTPEVLEKEAERLGMEHTVVIVNDDSGSFKSAELTRAIAERMRFESHVLMANTTFADIAKPKPQPLKLEDYLISNVETYAIHQLPKPKARAGKFYDNLHGRKRGR